MENKIHKISFLILLNLGLLLSLQSNIVPISDLSFNNQYLVITLSDIPDMSGIEGSSITINLDDYISDNLFPDSLITWTFSGNSFLSVSIDSLTRAATIAPVSNEWYGSETILFTATNPVDETQSDAAVFSITPVNDPPVVEDIPNQAVLEGALFLPVSLNGLVADVDHPDPALIWSATGNTLLTVAINPATKIATITIPNTDWNGTELITYTATDPGGLSDSDSATFTVTPVNDPPVVADIPNQTVLEGTLFLPVSLNGLVADVDHPDAALTWSAIGNTQLTVAINPATKIATITTPNTDWNGTELITFTATDPGELSDSDSATFTVTPVNDPPVVADIPNQTVLEGALFLPVSLNGLVADVDHPDPALIWSATGNTLLTVAINPATKIATITIPNTDWNGTELITFTATDPGGLSDSDSATFTVTPVNDPPVLTEIENSPIAYLEGDGAKRITSGIQLSDTDNINLASATISIINGFNSTEDSLVYQNTSDITGTWNSEIGVLNLSGTASVNSYQLALRSINYLNSNEINPGISSRRIRFLINDGHLNSNTLTRDISIIQVNDPPSARNIEVTGSKTIFSVLNGSYTYADPEGDEEGNSEFGWDRTVNAAGDNLIKIPGAFLKQYRLQFADGGKWVRFAVKPTDIKNGVSLTAYYSNPDYINAAPEALNPVIEGLIGLDQTVTAAFDYNDIEDNSEDTQNHIYAWYRANNQDGNSGKSLIGSNKYYAIGTADEGKYISFEITPAAESGSLLGDTFQSEWFGPIGKLPSAQISGTDSVCAGDTARLTVRLTYGTAPWSFTYTINRKNPRTVTGINSATFILKTVQEGAYELVSMRDVFRRGSVSGKGDVVIRTAPTAKLTGGGTICEGTVAELRLNLTGRLPWNVKYKKDNLSPVTVTNIMSYTHLLWIKNKGIYTLTEVTDNYCTGSVSGSATVSVIPAPEVEITGLNNAYSIAGKEVPVFGTPKGGLFTGDGLLTRNDSVFFYPSWAGLAGSPHKILYTFESPSNGCIGKDSVMVDVLAVKADIIFPDNKTLFCYNDKPFTIRGANVENVTGELTISGGTGLKDNGDNTALIEPSKLTGGEYQVTFKYFDKAWFELTESFTIEYVNSIWFIGFEKNTFCNHEDQYPLNGNMDLGVFYGNNVTGNFQTGYFYLPSFANPGKDTIYYNYTTPTGCSRSISEIVTILDAPDIVFSVDDICIETGTDNPIQFINNTSSGDSVINWHWNFDDPSSGENNTSNLKNPVHYYSSAGSRYILLRATSSLGCIASKEQKFTFGDRPFSDFTWDNECFHENDPVLFTDHSTIKIGVLEHYQWEINHVEQDSVYLTKDFSYTFGKPGNYSITHSIQSNFGCMDSVTKILPVRPTHDISTDQYFEDFETGMNGWNSSAINLNETNSWFLGNNEDKFPGTASGRNYWYTQIYPGLKEQSFVASPCFDFTSAIKPMIKFDIRRHFDQQRDGIVLQYTYNNGKDWYNLGDLNSGIQWYNKYAVKGLPGGQSIGWSDIKDDNWIEARHYLDTLKGLRNVQFRLAYGSDGTNFGNNGVAFDNFWLGNRKKIVMLEHFTNTSDTASISANILVEDVLNKLNGDVVNLQYHTSFPGVDPLNLDNPVVPEARVFYYGLVTIPYTLMDGGKDGIFRYDYYLQKPEIKAIQLQSLIDPAFEIYVNTDYSATSVNIDLTITALKSIPLREYTLHIVVIEKEINKIQSANGETSFRNVVKTLIPGPAGSYIYKGWLPDETLKLNYSWDYTNNVRHTDQLRVVVFIQDESTREVYQAAIDKFDIISSNPDIRDEKNFSEYTVYPNPASDFARFIFSSALKKDFLLKIYSTDGKLVIQDILETGTMDYTLNTWHLEKGLYLISLSSKDELLIPKRLMVNH